MGLSRPERGSSRPGSTFTAAVLSAEDWFESYRSEEGMGAAFFRLNRKTRRPPAA